MIEQVGNYIVRIEENSIEVLPDKPNRPRLRPRQTATFTEAHTLRPGYVRDYVLRKLRYIGYVYLYHFDRRYPAGARPGHYLGFAKDVEYRELRHLAGRGARLLQVVSEAGIGWQIANVWIGDRYLERRLKKEGHFERHCIFCKQQQDIESGN